MFNRLRRLPLELRVALAATTALFLLNILWALNQPNWKIDPGLATLVGAVVGLGIVAYQARRGFANLIRSQANQAELDRQARLHQAEIEQAAKAVETQLGKEQLLAAIRAEVVAVLGRVQAMERSAEFQLRVAKMSAEHRLPTTAKEFIIPCPKAVIFPANIDKIGLLGPSLGADVITVLSRVDGLEKKIPFEVPLPHEMMFRLFRGMRQTFRKWGSDLYHVAMRIRAEEEGTADPGTLIETESARYTEIEEAGGDDSVEI